MFKNVTKKAEKISMNISYYNIIAIYLPHAHIRVILSLTFITT